MDKTAKLFMNGSSQAVRLPSAYRFDCEAVKIRRNPISGEVIISALHKNWDSFLQLADATTVPPDFLNDRTDDVPQAREAL